MDKQDDQPELEGGGAMPGPDVEIKPPGEAIKVERKRRKVSLIGAIIVNVVTLITLAIVMLAILLPGYRRSFTVARATKGADEVIILVRTSESMMRENSTDFIRAQDGLRNALEEEVGGDGQVWAYVRDGYPDLDWIVENLPERTQKWLEELYPKPEPTETPGEATQNGEEQPAENTGQ